MDDPLGQFELKYFSTGMESLVDDDVDNEPREKKASSQFPLNAAETLLNTSVLFKDSVPEKNRIQMKCFYHDNLCRIQCLFRLISDTFELC